MKTNSTSRSAFFNPRALIGFVLCSVGLLLALAGLSKSVTGTIATAGAANPVPLINQPLVLDATAPGGPGFTLTVNGTGFVSGASVNWNGGARATTFVSGSQLTADILASDIATASTASVTVVNPSPGGGTSNVVFLPITIPSSAVALSHSDYAAGLGTYYIVTADFNADGKQDFAVNNSTSNTISIFLGNGDGTFQSRVDYSTGPHPVGIVTGDLNRDGKLDLATADQFSDTVSILLGNGDGTFQGHADYAAGPDATNLNSGDFNADGNLDLVVANTFFFHTVSILLGNGDGTFQPPVTYNTGNVPRAVTVGDFNSDNKLDLAVANEDCCSFLVTTVSILLGNGDGTFQRRVDYEVGSAPLGITAADFNADGRLDLATANFIDNTVSILLGNGDGTFQAYVDYAAAPGSHNTAVGDLNGDGRLDLAVANEDDSTISILAGKGDGTFQPRVDYATGSGPVGVAAADFNRDGRLDIVTGNAFDNTVSVLLQITGASEDCVPPPAGLVSWWSGDRTAEDVQGTNNGTLLNGTSFSKGMVGPSFLFDGIDDYISVPNNASLNPRTGDFTFEFWIRTTNSGAREAVLEKRPACGAANFYQIKMNADGTIFSETMQDENGTNFVTVTSTFPINDGVFHHVALTRQGVNVTLFIDGVQNATGSSPTTCNLSNAAPFIVGRTVCTFDRTFHGKIDELTYYTSALSPSAVQAIYTAGATGKCKPEIFVASIDPSYTVSSHGFRISTSILIQDVNGVGINGATVQLGVILPSGSALTFPLKTDATGQADVSFTVADSGLYQFKVRKVNHPTREYDALLNIETSDTLLIP